MRRLYNLKPASTYEVADWLNKAIELTDYQKSKLSYDESIRFSPFEFYKKKEPVKNVWFRLTIILFPIAWLFLVLSLPLRFLATGEWGYSYNSIQWFSDWIYKLGI